MKKRNLIYFLILILSFNMIIPVAAEKDSESFVADTEVLFMRELGILDNEDINTEITRGEFAVYAAKLFKENTEGGAKVRYFKDVDPNSRQANSIHLLYEKGIVNGRGDGTFGANEKISNYDAAVILLRIAGYSAYAEVKGYQTLIAENDILKGVSGNNVSVLNLAKMFYNILNTPVCVIEQYNGGNPVFDVDGDYLLMEKLFSMYEVRGILKGADGVCIEEDLTVSENTVIIGDYVYEVKDSLADKMYNDLGCIVDAYVSEDEYGVETVVFYSVDKKTEKTIIKYSDLIAPIDDELVIKYYENGKTKTINLPDDIKVLKNGKLYTEEVWEAFSGTQGVITVLEDSEIFLVNVAEYDSVLVSGVNPDDKMIYAKYGKSVNLDESKLDRVRIYLADGSLGTISDIKAGMFLTVFRGEKSIEIRVSNNVIAGKMTAFDDTTITIDDGLYFIENDYIPLFEKSVELLANGNFYLNCLGEVAYFVKGADESVNYGVIVRVIDNEDNDSLNIKIFNDQGKMEVFETVEKLNIDGKRYEQKDVLKTLKNAGDGTPSQLVVYSVNSEGKIFEIDTKAENVSGTGLKVTGEKMGREWYATGRMMMPDIVLKSDAVIFKTPPLKDAAIADESKFAIMLDLPTNETLDCEAYTTEAMGFYSEALLIPVEKVSNKITWGTHPLMVSRVHKAATDDGDIETIVTLAGNPTTVAADKGIKEYRLSDEFEVLEGIPYPIDYPGKKSVDVSQLGAGDLVYIATNQDKEIDHILMFYDYDNPEFTISDIAKYKEYPGNEGRFVAGYAVDRDDAFVALSTVAPDGKIDEFAHFNGSGAVPIVVFDSSLRVNNVYEGSIADVLTYNEAGENASVVVPYTFNGWAREIFIYKNGL